MPIPPVPKNPPAWHQFCAARANGPTGTVSEAQTAPSPGDGFNPNANSIVTALALQPDGKILVGGYFTQFQPYGSPRRAMGMSPGQPDGSVDTSIHAPSRTTSSGPWCSNPTDRSSSAAGSRRSSRRARDPACPNYAARLNADGTVDSVFNPNTNGAVYAIASSPTARSSSAARSRRSSRRVAPGHAKPRCAVQCGRLA